MVINARDMRENCLHGKRTSKFRLESGAIHLSGRDWRSLAILLRTPFQPGLTFSHFFFGCHLKVWGHPANPRLAHSLFQVERQAQYKTMDYYHDTL